MLTLHGLPISNYYNKVKFALLEKGVPFEEAYVPTQSQDEAVRNASPLGKVPFLSTPQGPLCESQVIMEYIEAAYPAPALMPKDPFAAAKVRELITYIDWHLEITARQLYGPAFFKTAPLSESHLARVRKQLEDAIAGFKRLVKFSPYIAGDQFTQADCAAWASLPLVSMATRATYGADLLAAGGIDTKAYMALVGARPAAQKVAADRKASLAKPSGA